MTVFSALLLAAPVLAGCAGEDAEAGEAAYPPIGYTPPPQQAPPQQAPPQQAPPQQAPPQVAAADDPPADGPPTDVPPEGPSAEPPAQGAWQWAPPGEDETPPAAPAQAPTGAGDAYADTDPSALTDFHSTLDPYGSWVDDPTYGTLWVPSPGVVGPDFTPYVSGGHWAYDDDYTWVSDYDWGWAPFHYGRWVYAGTGWGWVPGRTYAGAWVSWRYGYDDWAYVGWAPLAPTWCWHGGVAVGLGYVPRAPYAFVGTGELFAPSIGGRVIAGAQVGIIASHTRPFVPAPTGGIGGRVAASPRVGGPALSDLHIAQNAVVRAPLGDRGLTAARAFARPSTAVALGARAPASFGGSPGAGRLSAVAYGGRPVTLGSGGWAQGRPGEPSHFGGRFGGGFTGSVASTPPMRSYQASPRPYFGAPAARAAGPAFRGSPAATFRSPAPTFRAGPSGGFSRAPSMPSGGFHAAPSSGGGGFHGGATFHSGGGGFHGGATFHSGGGGGHGGGHR